MSDQPIAETATYITQNVQTGQTSMPSARFEPRNPSNRAATTLCLRPQGHGDQLYFQMNLHTFPPTSYHTKLPQFTRNIELHDPM